jgi:hypothetical protein
MIKMFIARPPSERGRWGIWETGTLLLECPTQAEALAAALGRARVLAHAGQAVELKQERADGDWDHVLVE